MKNQIAGNYKSIKEAIEDIKDCLEMYYDTKNVPRNKWRFDALLKEAKTSLKKDGEFFRKGAQYGGKFGNYCRYITLSPKGEYVYFECWESAFNKELSKLS